jgi:hypothetical protein
VVSGGKMTESLKLNDPFLYQLTRETDVKIKEILAQEQQVKDGYNNKVKDYIFEKIVPHLKEKHKQYNEISVYPPSSILFGIFIKDEKGNEIFKYDRFVVLMREIKNEKVLAYKTVDVKIFSDRVEVIEN